MAAIVVQLGLAMMPLGGLNASAGLTSDTTSGTSGSVRQAEELSITMAPTAATLGGDQRCCLPLEKSARSRPAKSAVAVSSTTISPSPHGDVGPLSEPRRRTGPHQSGMGAARAGYASHRPPDPWRRRPQYA